MNDPRLISPRWRALKALLMMLRGGATAQKIMCHIRVSERTLARIVADIRGAGFRVWKDQAGRLRATF